MSNQQLIQRGIAQQQEHAIITLDVSGVVVDWTGAARKLFGYASTEMVGHTLDRLYIQTDLDRGELSNELSAAEATGSGEDDRWMLRKDRSRFWASGVVTPIRDEGQALLGFIKVVRDRTDVRAQLDTVRNKLGATEQTESSRNVFIGTLAHELRNPVSVLINAVNLLQARPEGAAIAKAIELMERQLRFITRLMDDLADTALVLEGKLRLNPKLVELNQLIAASIETCGPILQSKSQNVETHAASPISLEGDPVRLQQVLINLINNAAKFSPTGATIWVKATVEGSEAVIRVQDSGAGIAPDFLPRIFDLFSQAELRDQGRVGGMGLGLPLVKRLVDLHHGTVQAKSEGPGKGTQISVRLPLKTP